MFVLLMFVSLNFAWKYDSHHWYFCRQFCRQLRGVRNAASARTSLYLIVTFQMLHLNVKNCSSSSQLRPHHHSCLFPAYYQQSSRHRVCTCWSMVWPHTTQSFTSVTFLSVPSYVPPVTLHVCLLLPENLLPGLLGLSVPPWPAPASLTLHELT